MKSKLLLILFLFLITSSCVGKEEKNHKDQISIVSNQFDYTELKAISISKDFKLTKWYLESNKFSYFYTKMGCCGEDSTILIKLNDQLIYINRYGSTPPDENLLQYSFSVTKNLNLDKYLNRSFPDNEHDFGWTNKINKITAKFIMRYAYIKDPLDNLYPLSNEIERNLENLELSKDKTMNLVYYIETNNFKQLFTKISVEKYKKEYGKYLQWVKESKRNHKGT